MPENGATVEDRSKPAPGFEVYPATATDGAGAPNPNGYWHWQARDKHTSCRSFPPGCQSSEELAVAMTWRVYDAERQAQDRSTPPPGWALIADDGWFRCIKIHGVLLTNRVGDEAQAVSDAWYVYDSSRAARE